MVEQEEREITRSIFATLVTNLVLCTAVTVVVLVLTILIFKAYNRQIEALERIIPICCICKKIRDDSGYWDQVEAYISKHSGLIFSHGICPDCMKKHYSGFSEDNGADKQEKN